MRSIMVVIVLLSALFTSPAGAEGWQRGARPEPLIKQGAQRLSTTEVRSMIVSLSSWASLNLAK